MPMENFWHVAHTHYGYVKHSPGSGKYSAFWIRTMRPTKHFLLKEKWLSSRFLKIKLLKLCQASEYSAILCLFWQRLWLQKAVENFLYVVRIRSGYVKHSSRSGKCSALWIMTVWSTKHFLFDKVLTPPFPHGLDAASLIVKNHQKRTLLYPKVFVFVFKDTIVIF